MATIRRFIGRTGILVLLVALAALLGSTVASAGNPEAGSIQRLTFDELPFQPVDGLSYRGVTFNFTVGGVPSLDANYNSGGPGQLVFVQDPSLEGNATGVLTLTFDEPTNVLAFGAALSSGGTLRTGFAVELFAPDGHSRSITAVRTRSLRGFTEGRFSYAGLAVKRAVIRFNPYVAPRFAFDNLSYQGTATTADASPTTPDNGTRPGPVWPTAIAPGAE